VTTKEEVELIRLRLGRSHSWSTSEAIIAAGQLLSALDDANRRIAELEAHSTRQVQQSLELMNERSKYHAEALELEAKLAAVREWLSSDDCDGTESLHWRITLDELIGV
jgi:hypothetical protein